MNKNEYLYTNSAVQSCMNLSLWGYQDRDLFEK